MDCPSSQMKKSYFLFHNNTFYYKQQICRDFRCRRFTLSMFRNKECWLLVNLRWSYPSMILNCVLSLLVQQPTATEPGLLGATLLSLLSSLFNDLNLAVIGDLSSSSEVPTADGDKDEKFSGVWVGMSITNIP